MWELEFGWRGVGISVCFFPFFSLSRSVYNLAVLVPCNLLGRGIYRTFVRYIKRGNKDLYCSSGHRYQGINKSKNELAQDRATPSTPLDQSPHFIAVAPLPSPLVSLPCTTLCLCCSSSKLCFRTYSMTISSS